MSEIEKERIANLAKVVCEAQPNNTKLSDNLIELVAQMVLVGCSIRAGCQLLGVTDRTYRNWMRWGREGKAPYDKFHDAVKRAEACHALELAQAWNHQAKRDWRAARAFLESRFPEDWGSRRRDQPPTNPPVVINVTLSPGAQLAEAIPAELLPRLNLVTPALDDAGR